MPKNIILIINVSLSKLNGYNKIKGIISVTNPINNVPIIILKSHEFFLKIEKSTKK